MGAFRAEVVIETWRLWREVVEEHRRRNPSDSIYTKMSVDEEAHYMAMHSSLRAKVWRQARENVKKMHKYHVQECKSGKATGWVEIYANNDQEAAEKVAGPNLRRAGKLGELRARVRPASNLNDEIAFYSDN